MTVTTIRSIVVYRKKICMQIQPDEDEDPFCLGSNFFVSGPIFLIFGHTKFQQKRISQIFFFLKILSFGSPKSTFSSKVKGRGGEGLTLKVDFLKKY